jgi:hypothetical protein
MLDTKRILQLGIGVAVGMVAYHFISKAMNRGASSNETAGAFGFRGAKPQRDALCLRIKEKKMNGLPLSLQEVAYWSQYCKAYH